MKIKKSHYSLKNDQSGIAAMVVVILIMTILTLIVLAMTQNSNREQRQAADRQLSSQAFYAAESGYNDAKDFIANPPSGVIPPLKKTECEGVSGAEEGGQFPDKESQVGNFENTKYTCVLYDRTPNDLRVSSLGVDTPTIFPIEDAAAGESVSSLTLNWRQEGGGTNFANCPAFDKSLPRQIDASCEAGLVRVELIDPEAEDLVDSAFIIYVKPTAGGGSTTYSYSGNTGTSKQGDIVNARCNDANGGCRLRIEGINKEKLYLNIRSIYKTNEIEIAGTRSDGGEVRFRDAQMDVDSTGQAADILRRVKVRIDLTGLNSGFIPPFVLQTSTDLCKRLQVLPESVTEQC